jgi:hypothetical protein
MNSVTGSVRVVLRAEGFAVLVASIVLYERLDASWLRFAVLFLAPDLSFAGYLGGTRLGAYVYNAAHNYVLPIALGLIGIMLGSWRLPELASIWAAHIGLDRLLGYGLKYPASFRETHLGSIGREARHARSIS